MTSTALMKKPLVMKKLQEEIRRLAGKKDMIDKQVLYSVDNDVDGVDEEAFGDEEVARGDKAVCRKERYDR
ncbi:hypothetical protein SASPL_117303 [Salvia splendens]|uniref:Uncharacterized protein n=1 Tax=Salvia splendens TaxID=180675 RepID=A0A8X8XUL5_SALSN|nr:hypothetical protein SASPL_117303 [Salvia splendens]